MLGQNTGTRRLREGALRAQRKCAPASEVVARAELITAMRDCAKALELRPALRMVLGELVACYGEQGLAGGLIVWPSNAYLVTKTGLSERAIRRILAELAADGLLVPVDSPNRKRYAVRDDQGAVVDAYGFDLMPIYAGRASFAGAVATINRERARVKRLFDQVTICRKACEEVIRSLREHFPGAGISDLASGFDFLVKITPARSAGGLKNELLDRWVELQRRLEERFLSACEEESGKAGSRDRHKEQAQEPSIEPCKSSERANDGLTPLTPDLVLRACPAVRGYTPGILGPGDVMRAGEFLRGSIGAHADAWGEAVNSVGRGAAAALVLYVLQLHEDDIASGRNRLTNPGGLYRSLIRRLAAGELDLRTEFQAMARRRMT